MLSVMYVEGINYVDTPNFTTLMEQTQYFNDKVVYDFRDEDYYYPPHYKNSIVVDSGDINLSLRINYLRLDYEGKSYYYFITNVSYNNIGSLILDIEMDVIQTYMFDINFINYKVTKRLINRYDENGEINRKYLRNNISNGIMQLKDYFEYPVNDSSILGWFIFKYNREDEDGESTPTLLKYYNSERNITQTSTDGTGIYIIPACIFDKNYNATKITYKRQIDDSIITAGWDTISDVRKAIHKLSENPGIVEAYYIRDLGNINSTDGIPHIKVEYDMYNYEFVITIYSGIASYEHFITTSDGIAHQIYIDLYHLSLIDTQRSTDLSFKANTSLKAPFDYHFVPQLIDENYINYKYGERILKASFPLSLLKNADFELYRRIDVNTGYRNYWISDDSNYDDKYNTRVTCTTKELVTLWNDYWKAYMNGNQGTLTLGLAYKSLSTLFSIMPNSKIGTNYTGSLVDEAVNYINLQYKAEDYKQGNNMTNDSITNAMLEVTEYYEVSDIDDVARHYESYGYDVHEVYTYKNIFTDMKTRYYYNYYEVEDMNITLNILNDNTTINNIKDRFKSGVRLWEINNMDDLKLGQVCLYDNVEIKEVD